MSDSTAVLAQIEAGKLAKYVRFLTGSFRVGEAEDGEVIARGLTALLGVYPEWVVRAVCDPRSGLPATSKFFPTLFEVRAACDAKMRPALEAERQRRIAEANTADRPAPVDKSDSARRKAFIAEWRSKQASVEIVNAVKLHEMDLRKIAPEDRRREFISKAMDADIARQSERNRSMPVEPLGSWRGIVNNDDAA